MLADVFQEYARKFYDYLVERIPPTMDVKELIETIVKSYYSFSVECKESYLLTGCTTFGKTNDTIVPSPSCDVIFNSIARSAAIF